MKKFFRFALTFGRACSRSAEKASFFSSHSIAALMAATVCGLSLAVTSCKDDDKDKGNGDGEPTAEEIATDNATTFWGVAANLVSPFDVTVEYEDKTFEPTIGMAENGGTVRQEPKTTANNSIFGSQQYYYYTKSKDFYTPGLTGIFKEPVLIMRLMKVTDNGGTTPNLTVNGHVWV